ncbi:MAG: PorP/SprF family type IX secretion system membrane protein [Bacteroidota bacterium]|jgi:type IX secretion system PorP/SprF family membrane protein
MKKIFTILLFVLTLGIFAQDPASSQFFFNQLYMNPSFAGINRDARFGLDYRRQWAGIPGKFETYDCWGDIYSNLFNGGLGFVISEDVSGDGYLRTTNTGIIQSFEYTVPKIVRIRAGISVAGVIKRIDWNKLVFSDQIDPVLGVVYETNVERQYGRTRAFADFGTGFMFDFHMIKTKHAVITNTAGYSVNHLTQPNESLSGAENQRLPRKHTFHLTTTIEMIGNGTHKSKWFFSPNIIYDRQGIGNSKGVFPFSNSAQFSAFNIGMFVMNQPAIGGLFFRKKRALGFKDNDAFIMFLGFKHDGPNKTVLKFGYSYDFTISNLSSNSLGSHEISISVEFKNRTLRLRGKRGFFNSRTDCEDFGQRSFLF